MLAIRTVLQWLFGATMLVVTVLTFIIVVPAVLLWEALRRPPSRVRGAMLAVLALLAALSLAGCDSAATSKVTNALGNTVDRASQVADRAREFAATAPNAPYQPIGNRDALDEAGQGNGLQLDGHQLALVRGAAAQLGVDAQLLGYVVEREVRGMDENEAERDVLGALAGEDTSIGLAQVKLSTALEIEREDQLDLFPAPATDDDAVVERVRRLAADDWSLLYAAAYLSLLAERYPGAADLDLATMYTGANPSTSSADQRLYDAVGAVLPKE